jgi:DMSO reductase anchor subunit
VPLAYRASREAPMGALIVILLVLWFFGIITKNTLGGFLNILLVVAIVFLLIRVIRGRPV